MLSSASGACAPSETNICMSVDLHAGETGYYVLDRGSFAGITPGPSPEITVKIGQTIVFDQEDPTNWYHPVGFAYAPDGAHGDDWGADENPEVEGVGELQYKIDGAIPTCADAGDTGLDCYEPEFFYPRGDWMAKKYTAELTITDAVAAASKGGVIYYFCHIHSKMSGKIVIKNADGSDYVSPTDELALYDLTVNDAFDTGCGTSGISQYADGGDHECDVQFFGGEHDTEFEKCLQAIDCQMNSEMYSQTGPDESDPVAIFMQQMIPHHVNAVNMAKLLLKNNAAEVSAVEDLEDTLHSIINVQNFQIHYFRNHLNPMNKLIEGSHSSSHDSHSSSHDSHSSHDSASGLMISAFVLMISGIVSISMV